ncbi:MAG: STAS domain-containing protein [Mycobacteriales bacterium]
MTRNPQTDANPQLPERSNTQATIQIDVTVSSSRSAIVDVAGEVDLETAPELRAALAAVSDSGVCVIDMNFTSTAFMDSTGLAVLIAALRRCQHRGGRLRVVEASPAVARLLHATRLSRIFAFDA